MTKITKVTPGKFNRSIKYQSRAQREEEIKGQNNKAIILRLHGSNKWNFLSGNKFSSFVRGAEFSESTPALYEQRDF